MGHGTTTLSPARRLELRTFGGLAVRAENGPVEGAGAQKRRLALLALVDASGDRGISRERLLSYLWGDAELENARGALAQALYSLRKSLGAEDLFLGTNELRLNRAILESDRSQFLSHIAAGAFEAAVACYAGPYLDGFSLNAAPEFEVWVDGERAALAHRYVSALQKLAARAEAVADVQGAIGWWRKLVVVDPLNGQLALGLMRALVAAGDRAGAIQHARIYDRLVQQELDVPGDPEVGALAEHLKQPAAAAAPASEAPVPRVDVPAPAPPSAAMSGPPRVRHSLAEQLSTSEVVAVAMARLKASRSAFDSFSGVNRAADRDRARSDRTPEAPSLALVQERMPRDRYLILRELGAGGMATVYLARDVRHDRDVAIKVLREELGVALGAERFLAEIRTTARLQHPHILPLLDSGTVGEGPGALLYYVMPHVAGETLRQRLAREKQLPLDDALRIARDVADALAYAHAQQVVHRDIKPENILLQGNHALVADFGIAIAVQSAGGERITQAGLSLGTPEYMAPEQALGRSTVDHRVDLYALGAVTYEMLTGDPPFTGSTAQSIVAKLLTERPVMPRVVRETIPVSVEAAVMTALAKLPADRHSSAGAFSDALAARVEAPVPPPPTGPTPTIVAARPPGGNRRLMVGVTVASALVAVALVARWRETARPIVMGSVTQVTRSRDTLNFDAAISPDGKFVAYASTAAGQMRLFIRQVSGSAPVPITTGLAGDHRFPRWSPDGSRLVFVADNAIHVIPVLGGVAQRLTSLQYLGGQPAWSADGTQLAFSDTGGISVAPATGGPARRIVRMLEAHSPSWSPDGTRIVFVVENLAFVSSEGYGNVAPSSIWTASVAGGDSAVVAEAAHLNTAPTYWPDGRSILFVSDRDGPRDVYRQGVDRNGRPRGELTRITSGLNAVSFTLTRDGDAMAYGSLQLRDNIWMAPIAAVGMTPEGAARAVTTERQSIEGLALSHDGRWLAYDSNRHGNLNIFKVAFNGTTAVGEPVALTTDPAPDYEPRWSPDDSTIVFYSRRFGTRDVFTVRADGRQETRVTSAPGNEFYPDWSPDGQLIVYSSQVAFDWDVTLLSREANGAWSAPRPLGTSAQRAVDVRWTGDGRSLLLVRDSVLGLLSVGGREFHRIVDARALRETITFVSQGRGSSQVYFQTRDSTGIRSFWSAPATGGAPRRLLRLADPSRRTRRAEFDTDGRNLFFTVAEDEADIAVAQLKRP